MQPVRFLLATLVLSSLHYKTVSEPVLLLSPEAYTARLGDAVKPRAGSEVAAAAKYFLPDAVAAEAASKPAADGAAVDAVGYGRPAHELEPTGRLDKVSRCGTPALTPAQKLRAERHVTQVLAQAKIPIGPCAITSNTTFNISIPTYIHVISTNNGGNGVLGFYCGKTPTGVSKCVQNQLDVLNAAYSQFGINFTLMGYKELINDTWFRMAPNTTVEVEAKTALGVGTNESLNVYIAFPEGADSGPRPLGWAWLPSSRELKTQPKLDGVVISYRTTPGGTTDASFNFRFGDTLVHEVGHWLGLYHTFEGGCTNPGDYVNDTPAEATGATSCTTIRRPRNTCIGKNWPGDDPVHNYMDATDDTCVYEFTLGQVQRMKDQWVAYRQGKYADAEPLQL